MSTKVKGAALLARRTFVLDEYGEEGWQRVLEALPEEVRREVEGLILSTQWFPFEICAALDGAIVDSVGGGNRDLFKRIGARSAQENLTGPHRHFLADNPQAFLDRTDRIYRFYYDVGRRDYETTGPTSGVMTTYEAETFSNNDCLTVIGWYEKALEMCGAQNVRIVEETCRAEGGPYCRYRLSWSL